MTIPHPITQTILSIDDDARHPDQVLGRKLGATLDGNAILPTGILVVDPKHESEGIVTEENVAKAASSQRIPGEIK